MSVIRGRLLTNMVDNGASRAARKLADNLDEKKVLSSDCTIFCFARLEHDIDAYYTKGATSVGTGGFPG